MFAAENVVAPEANAHQQQTNLEPTLRAILQLEERLRSNQAAIELNGLQAREAAARSTETLSAGLQKIEHAVTAQQENFSMRTEQELEAIQRSNRASLVVAGTFAGVAFLAIAVMTWFQWRLSRVWAGMTALWPPTQLLNSTTASAAFLPAKPSAELPEKLEQSDQPLLGAVAQLEKRIEELEQTARAALKPYVSKGNGGSNSGSGNGPTNTLGAEPVTDYHVIAALLGEGKSKLKENDLEGALVCFDQVLVLDPKHGEALVKKGATLERLQKLNEAFECYDRAIAADENMTIAYLHKGGLCNRLERFKEALECYEKALRTQNEQSG